MAQSRLKNMLALTACLFAGSLSAQAQEEVSNNRPYFFSGPCASQGAWTQQAMNLTQKIRQVAENLRQDPNCKAASNSMQAMLTQMTENLKAADSAGGNANTNSKLTSIPQEIAALRTFMSDKSEPPKNILQTMMKKAVEYSTLSAEAAANGGSATLPGSLNSAQANKLLSLGQRVQSAALSGIQNFNGIVDTVGQNAQCLSGPQQGQFLAAAAATLASFVGSGQDQMGQQLALSISKLANLSRELKFSKVFKELNKAEFMNSMSCLMEITSESFCSARDGNKLFEEMNRKIRTESPDQIAQLRKGLNPNSPLSGYYILTQQVPLVSSWLQKVQIGVEPKLGTDAMFKNRVLQKVTQFYTVTNNVLGVYNEKAGYIQRDLKENTAKKNNIIELIGSLSMQLDGANPDGSSSEFFAQTYGQKNIPFLLLGLPKAPDAFFETNSTIDYATWLQKDQNWATIPSSSNPDQLVEIIGQNLRKLVEATNENVIAYYNRFFIFDKSALYLDALLGTNYNVKDALISIDQYLGTLQQKFSSLKGNSGVLVSVIETRGRIGSILKKFKAVEALGEKMKAAPRTLSLTLVDEIKSVHMNFINEVYEKFDILLGRSSWLSARMARFVYYDYSISLRNGVDLSHSFKDMFYATGFAAYDKMLSMASGDPAAVESDLKSAIDTNRRNIQALELLFRDNLVGMIREQGLVSRMTEAANMKCGPLKPNNFRTLSKPKQLEINGKIAACVKEFEITPGSVYWEANKQAYLEGANPPPGVADKATGRERVVNGVRHAVWDMVIKPCVNDFQCLGIRNDKYDIPDFTTALFNSDDGKLRFDDESGSAKYLLARLCIQSLAFSDLKPYWNMCNRVILESNFQAPAGSPLLKDLDGDYFKINYVNKAYEDIENPALNQSQKVCAFRDFFRRNQVLYMTMGMQDNLAYQPEYAIEEAPATPPAQGKNQTAKSGTNSYQGIDMESAPAQQQAPKNVPSTKTMPKPSSKH